MVSPLFLRTMQVSLESIGLTSFFGLPWAVKFLWAPSIDRFGTRRSWMLILQLGCGLLFVAVGLCTAVPGLMIMIAALLLAGSFAAATHDIAIDGYYLASLDAKEQTAYVGYRVMAYRIAMMTGTGLVATIGISMGWLEAFFAAGGMLLLLFVFHRRFLPAGEKPQNRLIDAFRPLLRVRFVFGALAVAASVILLYMGVNSPLYTTIGRKIPLISSLGFAGWISLLLLGILIVVGCLRRRITPRLHRKIDSFYSQAFLSFMDRPCIGLILACIIFLRTGEFLLSAMTAPFMVDMGIKVHYGWIQAVVGLPASIAGAMLGGWCICRFSLKRVLLPFLLAQNGSNLIYMALAFSLQRFILINTGNADPLPLGSLNLAAVAAMQGFDQFAGGLGTAILMTFLMRICKAEFAAAHYAIGSGLMSLSGLFTGVGSGLLAAQLGYGWFFGISFLVSMPGMFLAYPAMKVLPSAAK